jgi:RNA polymerase sigma factor (TIGR02999 family)
MDITKLLHRVHAGDQTAFDEVIPLVYSELKKLASAHLRREGRAQPLQTTALVHEAFLRLAGGRHPAYENRSHFYGIAARVMRQILVDTARARGAGKRSAVEEVELADIPDPSVRSSDQLLAMDEALARLEKIDPVKAQLIDMRYFGGMTAEESAEALAMPVLAVRRELRLAQAWLRKELSAREATAGPSGAR